MTTERPLQRKQRRFRRILLVLLLFLIGLSIPTGVFWFMEKTEQRIRATERLLMEEVALLRAEVAALSQQQRLSQEAVEQLTVKTDALAELWQSQVDKPSLTRGQETTMSSADEGVMPPEQQASTLDGTEDGGENPGEGRDAPFWLAWWTAGAYYAMKASQYVPALYQLVRLHPAIP